MYEPMATDRDHERESDFREEVSPSELRLIRF